MNIEQWEAKLYKTSDEFCPLVEWLGTLPKMKSAKILEDIQHFEDFGPKHKPNFSEKLTKTISYIRTKHQKDSYRIFWFHWHDRVAVLTHGYQKKQNKADLKEIKRAESYRKDWLNRY